MKKIITATALTLGLITLTACGSGNGDPDIVVETEVGDVTKEEFYEALKQENGGQVLNELVTMVILEHNYDITDEEVEAELDNLKDQLGDAYEDALQAQGLSEDTLKADLKKGLLQEKAIIDNTEVTDEEMEQYYERMQTEVKAKHILVEDEETAEEVIKKLDDGEEFDELAKEYSEDTASAEQGGEVGFFSAGEMVEAFEDAAYTLELDTLSEPVESDFGYHIIIVTDRQEIDEDIGSFKDNKEEIQKAIVERKVDPETAMQTIDKLVTDTKIKVKIKEFEDLFKRDGIEG